MPLAHTVEAYSDSLAKSAVPKHLHAGLVMYLVYRCTPGGFLMAVLRNDLSDAMGRADETSRAHLFDLVAWLHNEAPGDAWGTYGRVRAWIERWEHPDRADASQRCG